MILHKLQVFSLQSAFSEELSPKQHSRMVPWKRRRVFPPGMPLLCSTPRLTRLESAVCTVMLQTYSNSLIAGESINHGLISIDLPELQIVQVIRGDERHCMKRKGLTLITVGTGVGCFHC